jgi:hypothetical protein
MSAYELNDPKHPGYAERYFDRADLYRDEARIIPPPEVVL